MHIANTTRFVLGILFLVVAAILSIGARREKGFGPKRQVVAICLAGAAIFLAIGLGYLEF
jgi:hypothetical protein